MLSQLSREEKMIIGVIAVAVLGVTLWVYKNGNLNSTKASPDDEHFPTSTTEQTATTTPTTTPAKTPAAAAKKPVTTTKTPSVKAGENYADVLKTYANWRFQFVNCQSTPSTFLIKKGSKFMLDNRDAKSHTYKVGTAAYNLGAYGWVLATANTLGNLDVTCDGINRALLKVVP